MRCKTVRREDQRGGNGPVPGTRRKAVPIAMVTGPVEYTAGQQELPVRQTSLAEMVHWTQNWGTLPLHLAPWLWSGLLRHRNDRSRVSRAV